MLEQSERPKRPDVAFDAYSMACQRQNLQACREKGKMFEEGLGVETDYTQARNLYQFACDNGLYKACLDQGEMYRQGRGLPDGLDTEKPPIFVERILSRGS